MMGVDTNVLVRYLTQDDPVQSKIANRWIDQIIASGEYLFINHLVLCELVWVLSRAYKFDKNQISKTIETLLFVKQFEFEDKNVVLRVLDLFKENQADFSDALIAQKNIMQSCTTTVTFDLKAAKLPTMTLLK